MPIGRPVGIFTTDSALEAGAAFEATRGPGSQAQFAPGWSFDDAEVSFLNALWHEMLFKRLQNRADDVRILRVVVVGVLGILEQSYPIPGSGVLDDIVHYEDAACGRCLPRLKVCAEIPRQQVVGIAPCHNLPERF